MESKKEYKKIYAYINQANRRFVLSIGQSLSMPGYQIAQHQKNGDIILLLEENKYEATTQNTESETGETRTQYLHVQHASTSDSRLIMDIILYLLNCKLVNFKYPKESAYPQICKNSDCKICAECKICEGKETKCTMTKKEVREHLAISRKESTKDCEGDKHKEKSQNPSALLLSHDVKSNPHTESRNNPTKEKKISDYKANRFRGHQEPINQIPNH